MMSPSSSVIVASLALFFLATTEAGHTFSKANYKRQGKFFFSIIKFRNDICNVSSTEQGICYSTAECAQRGGQQRTSCAAGFGTCCVFQDSCYSIRDEKISYFRNQLYPDPESTPNYCTYGIKVTDSDVCQIRLDFVDFRMGGPSMTTIPFGQCSGDRMAIFAGQNRLGLSEGNLICGDMTDQHIYIPTDASNGEENLSLFAMVGTSSVIGGLPTAVVTTAAYNYTWNIRIEQIDCSELNDRQAPDGCLQYFTALSGSIESFNFRDSGSPYPILLDYAICFKRQTGFCGITLTTLTEGDSFGLNTNLNNLDTGLACHAEEFTNPIQPASSDFLQLMGAYVSDGITRRPDAYFCGVYNAIDTSFPGISSSFKGPLVVRFKSDESLKALYMGGPVAGAVQAAQVLAAQVENGFKLTYTLTPNCPA